MLRRTEWSDFFSVLLIYNCNGNRCFACRIQKRAEAAIESDYPSYGFAGGHDGRSKATTNNTMSDRKLARSAQMYHYQQQRQQMMAQEKWGLDMRVSVNRSTNAYCLPLELILILSVSIPTIQMKRFLLATITQSTNVLAWLRYVFPTLREGHETIHPRCFVSDGWNGSS